MSSDGDPARQTDRSHQAEGETGERKAVRPGEPQQPRVERDGRMWHLRAVEPARQVLRARHQTTQAGFTAEYIPQGRMEHRPILISDGPLHDEQRSRVARFFAPTVVAGYADLMERCADRLLGEASTVMRLDDLALHYAVEVTAEIVGLTHAHPGEDQASRDRRVRALSHRLESFFTQPPFDLTRVDLGRSPRQWAQAAWNGLRPVASLWWNDVRPAVRQRKAEPRDDVLSHLLEEGYSAPNILIEAVTYGTAGMVTTREFIVMAAWHLLGDDDLRSRYLAAERAERHAILHEIIRLEPVVGHLYRRARTDIEISDGDESWTIPAGDLIDVCTRPANADPDAMGDDPLRLCPGRETARGVNAAGLAFGDGAHKCPGQPLAVWEADVLLTRLFALNPVLTREPTIGWDDLVAGYELRGCELRLAKRG